MYCGIDIHKKSCEGKVEDESGDCMREGRFSNNILGFKRFFRGMDIHGMKVVIESTGFWRPAYEILESMGCEVTLANPHKIKAIASAKIKNDKISADILVRLLRADLIPASYVSDKETRQLKDLLRHRVYLVRLRTRMKNKIHALLAIRGIEHEFKDLFSCGGIEFLNNLELDKKSKLMLEDYIETLMHLNVRIRRVSRVIKRIAEENDDAKLLMNIYGIGYYSAMMILTEIGDINRFPNSEKLTSYAGLVPSSKRSGERVKYGKIIKQSNAWLRWILIQCTHIHVRKDSWITNHYRKITKKKGKQKAVVAAARKMLKAIYWVLKEKEEFHAHKGGALRKSIAG
jgi:transposase